MTTGTVKNKAVGHSRSTDGLGGALKSKSKKLSKTQQEVLDLLGQGWEIGWSRTFDGGVWIQKGGAGRGGESRKVNTNTANALLKAGKIVCVYDHFPTARYRLPPNV